MGNPLYRAGRGKDIISEKGLTRAQPKRKRGLGLETRARGVSGRKELTGQGAGPHPSPARKKKPSSTCFWHDRGKREKRIRRALDPQEGKAREKRRGGRRLDRATPSPRKRKKEGAALSQPSERGKASEKVRDALERLKEKERGRVAKSFFRKKKGKKGPPEKKVTGRRQERERGKEPCSRLT